MINIHVIDTDGTARDISFEANKSSSLMEILTKERFDVAAICGGMAGCGTCHIAFESGGEGLDDIEDDEEFMLDSLPNIVTGSRLSCQLRLTKDLDGARIRILGDGV
ncbi:MAG: 2Fe-2S iron-sulfur cluster-binding protein [Bacteroidia bacterium]|nr:2Fe-2S iron-sulfur cluster-binding protein [Bacteroidia bacterium]